MSALQVLGFSDNGNCIVNNDLFNSVLTKVGHRPFVLYSINGRMRLGKSLTLNRFLRLLQTRTASSGNSNSHQNFEWRQGSERVTKGIHIWSDPFFLPNPNSINEYDNEIAILLMDTQGLFDLHTSSHQNSIMFSFSSLCSSVMIYNNIFPLDESALQNLEHFVTYAVATQLRDNNNNQQPPEKLQQFIFLLRDFTCPNEYPYGCHTEENPPRNRNYLIKTILPSHQNMALESCQVRQEIVSVFRKVTAFLLPDPGPAFKQSASAIGAVAEFDTEMNAFVRALIGKGHLELKKVFGNVVTGNQFKEFVSLWADEYRNINRAPPVRRLAQLNMEKSRQVVVETCFNFYNEEMEKFLKPNPGATDHDLLANHKRVETLALDKLQRVVRGGDKEELKTSLSRQIKSEYDTRIFLINKMQQTEANLRRQNQILIGGLAFTGVAACAAVASPVILMEAVPTLAKAAPVVIPYALEFVRKNFSDQSRTDENTQGPDEASEIKTDLAHMAAPIQPEVETEAANNIGNGTFRHDDVFRQFHDYEIEALNLLDEDEQLALAIETSLRDIGRDKYD